MKSKGHDLDFIGEVVGLDRGTISKHYPEELAVAREKLNLYVEMHAIQQIEAGSVDMTKFYLDRRVPEWRLKTETTLKGDEDAPLVIDDRVAARQIAYLLASAVRQDEPR